MASALLPAMKVQAAIRALVAAIDKDANGAPTDHQAAVKEQLSDMHYLARIISECDPSGMVLLDAEEIELLAFYFPR